jgi:hypothetical protein
MLLVFRIIILVLPGCHSDYSHELVTIPKMNSITFDETTAPWAQKFGQQNKNGSWNVP